MIKSVNHSWAVGSKQRQKYGDTWADIDFYFPDKISKDRFRNDPMNCLVGTLHVARQDFKFKYKDLIAYQKSVTKAVSNTYWDKNQEVIPVDIKSKIILLNKSELNRLRETLDDSLLTTQRGYEVGTYL